jgi:hypothetical protein
MAWALHELGSAGWGDAVVGALERYRREPDGGEQWAHAPSYLGGECGIALVGYLLTGDAGLADRLHELVLANLEDEWNEMLWGAAGSLLAAEAMLAWSGEERWEAAWDTLADELEAARDADGLWTQHRLGERRHYGVGHGFAGNQLALSHRRTVDVDGVLARVALRDGPLANWSPGEEAPPDRIRVQWCHGAPGIVAGLGEVMDEELALAGGELTWRAGPLAKGSGLGHGTAGKRMPPRPPPSDRRRALARARTRIRDARDRPGRAGALGRRPRPLLAVHRRRRRGSLPPPRARR